MPLEPQSQAIMNAINGSGAVPFRQSDPVTSRNRLLSLRVSRPVPAELEMESAERAIVTPDGSFKVRILRPRAGKMPVILYFHGGGFFAGGLDETDELARKIAKYADAVVVNVDYHLSPEAKFPVAVNDAYAALLWVVENAGALEVDETRIVLAGDSAGGNLAVAACLLARERSGSAIAYQVPIYPLLDLRRAAGYESRRRFGAGGMALENDDIDWMADHYLASPDEALDWRASPILAPSFAGLPPALVLTADHDPLMDEGLLYSDHLAKAGVEVESICFEGTFHGFVAFASVIEIGERAVTVIGDRIRRAVWKS